MKTRHTLTLAALTLAAALPARAEPGDAFEQLGRGGLFESALAQLVAGIDVDAAVDGIAQSAQATAEGQTVPEPEALTRAREQLRQNVGATAPMVARALFSALAPTVREMRAEIARDLAEASRD